MVERPAYNGLIWVQFPVFLLFQILTWNNITLLGWSNGKMRVSKTLRWEFESLTLRQFFAT